MSNYEFSAEQNEKFIELSRRLRHFAIFFGLTGFVIIINGLVRWSILSWQQGVPNTLAGVVVVIGAYFFYRPLDNFKNIVETEGHDIQELMKAMRDLNLAYGLMQFTLGLVATFILVHIILISFG